MKKRQVTSLNYYVEFASALLSVKKSFERSSLCLKKKHPEKKEVEFKVWFMRFKEGRSYHSITADEQEAVEFPYTLKKIIEENRFLSEQIFNVDATGLKKNCQTIHLFPRKRKLFQATRPEKDM